MSEVIVERNRDFVRVLAPGVWRLTGEVSDSLSDRARFTSRVLVGAMMGRIEDIADSATPPTAEGILADDARGHIGLMAEKRGLRIPEGFIPQP